MKQKEVVKLNHKHCGRARLVLLYTGGTVPKRGNGDEKGVAHCKLFFSQKFVFDRSRLNGFHITWACIRRSCCHIFTRLGIGTLLVTKRLGQLGATKLCEHTRHLLFEKHNFWGNHCFVCGRRFLCVWPNIYVWLTPFCVSAQHFLYTHFT